MKVYVIAVGEYSDYHVCAVTLDEDQAKLLQIRYSTKWDDAIIEEYDTDDYKMEADDIYKHMYYVEINRQNEIINFRMIDYSYYRPGDVYSTIKGSTSVYVEAKDEEHAKKIAKDIYMKWLAEQNDL